MSENNPPSPLTGADVMKEENATLPRWKGWACAYESGDLVRLVRRVFVVVIRESDRAVIRIFRGPHTDNILSTNDDIIAEKIRKIWNEYPHPDYDMLVGSGPLRDIKAGSHILRGWEEAIVEELWSV